MPRHHSQLVNRSPLPPSFSPSAHTMLSDAAGALPTGSLGMMARMAQQGMKKREADLAASGAAALKLSSVSRKPVVISGPPAVGKSTLIARLLSERSDSFIFAVSCTTVR